MTWLYKGKPLAQAPKEYEGFVYLIHNPSTNKFYIGQKRFWSVRKLPPLKGKTRKRTVKKESDWQDYWSSSEALQQDAALLGKEHFVRTVVKLCRTKGELNYYEAKLQFKYDVLLDERSYNGIINCKIHRSHLPKK
jgi:hypothetical protein